MIPAMVIAQGPGQPASVGARSDLIIVGGLQPIPGGRDVQISGSELIVQRLASRFVPFVDRLLRAVQRLAAAGLAGLWV